MKRMIAILIAAVMLTGTFPVIAGAYASMPEDMQIYKGIGMSIDENGTLTITNSPNAYYVNTSWSYYPPWEGNTAIKKVIIPDNVTQIGEDAFLGCSNLEEIVLPKNLKELHEDAFAGCNKIKNVTISEENATFKTVDGVLFDQEGERLFLYGKGRGEEEYTIPEGTREITIKAFQDCKTLKRINFNKDLRTIKDYAFKNLTELEEIEIPDTVAYIGQRAFENCEKLAKIKMSPYAYLQSNPFINTAFFNDEANWEDGALYLNKHLLGVKDDLTALEIKPDTVSIAGETFTKANIPYITVPSTVKSVGDKAFANNKNIVTVVFKEGFEILGHYAFWSSSIKSVNLPESLQIIGGQAFMHSEIEQIIIPDNVIDIGESAFECCDSLKRVVIGKRVGNISAGAFRTCHNLEEITIPDSVWNIGEYAFFYNSKLKKVTIGSNLHQLDYTVFSLCDNLATLEISENNPHMQAIDNVVFDKSGERLILYPAGKKADEYTVPEGVKIIGESALKGAGVGTITLPASIERVEYGNTLSKLGTIYYPLTANEWEKVYIEPNNHTLKEAVVHFSDGNVRNIYGELKCREEADKVYIIGLIDKSDTEVFIPGEINGKKTQILPGAFDGSTLVNVTLDENVKEIPPRAFDGCSRLENINLENVEYIGSCAFFGCRSLKDIKLLNIKKWDGIGEERLNTQTMELKLLPYNTTLIGYDIMSMYTVFYGARIENLTIKWPEVNFTEGAETFPALFLDCEINNVTFENFTISPSSAEFYGIDPSGRIKSVDPYVDLVKPKEELVIYGKDEKVKEYAEKIGVRFEFVNNE